MMVWEIRTNDPAAVFDKVRDNLDSGLTVKSDAFDWTSSASMVVEPVSRRVTLEQIAGKAVDEVRRLAGTAE